MGGGGSHGSGEVTYAEPIITRWSQHYDHISDFVRDNYDRIPRMISWRSEEDNWGNGVGSDSYWDIDPSLWYGDQAAVGSAGAALVTYKAFDPAAMFTAYADPNSGVKIDSQRISTLRAWLDSLWSELGDEAGTEATKTAMVNAFATRLADKINTDVIPKLETNLRNTNSVLSSAILMSKAAIWEGYTQEVADYSAKVDFEILGKKYSLTEVLAKLEPTFMQILAQSYDLALKRVALTLDHAKIGMATTLSLNDDWWTKYVKAKTILTEDEIRVITWNAELHDYLNKAIASLPGASVVGKNGSINAAASTISGGLSGAAAGAMAGAAYGGSTTGPFAMYGAIAGAVIGGVAGYLQSQ